MRSSRVGYWGRCWSSESGLYCCSRGSVDAVERLFAGFSTRTPMQPIRILRAICGALADLSAFELAEGDDSEQTGPGQARATMVWWPLSGSIQTPNYRQE